MPYLCNRNPGAGRQSEGCERTSHIINKKIIHKRTMSIFFTLTIWKYSFSVSINSNIKK